MKVQPGKISSRAAASPVSSGIPMRRFNIDGQQSGHGRIGWLRRAETGFMDAGWIH
jgi:hypothetical protein